MGRANEEIGDTLVVSSVANASPKDFPLAPVPQNVTYKTISLQPEAQPNQPLSVPITFHGGSAYDHYDEQTGGCLVNTGILTNEWGVLRAPVKVNTTTLTGAAAPVMYFFEEKAPNATTAYQATTSDTADSTSITVNHTVSAGDDRIVIAALSMVENLSLLDAIALLKTTTPTFGGQTMTGVGGYGTTSSVKPWVFMWYLVNPSVGAADCVVALPGTYAVSLAVTDITGVNQASPVGTYSGASGTSAAPSTDVIGATGELVIDVVASASNDNPTKGAGQTERWDEDIDSTSRGMGSTEAGSASTTMSWTAGNDDWAIMGVSLKQSLAPVLYANSVEGGEVNAYKVSLNDSDFGDLLATKTWGLVTTKPMGRCAKWTRGGSTYWSVPLGDNGLIDTLTTVAAGANDPTTETNDTWSAGTDADARHLLVVKNQLYRTTGANEVSILDRNINPETEANWGDEFYVGDAGFNITDIGQVAGICSVCKEDGVWEFDGVAEASNILPELGIAERNGQGLSFGRGGFFYPGVASLYWGLTGQPIGPDSFDDRHTANDPSIGVGSYFKHGRWNGTICYNGHFYGIYVNSLGTSAFIIWAYPVGEGWRWQVIASVSGDFNDFHGLHVTEKSKFSATEVRPCLFFANGHDLSWIWLDKNGAPMLRRGDIDLHASATVVSGRIDFGMPRVPKQLTYTSGWAEDFAATADHHQMQLKVYRDGGSAENVGTDITGTGSSPDGYFTKWWTQDTNDECRSLLFESEWTGTNSLTDQDGPLLRDLQLHAIAKPACTREWSFLIYTEDDTMRTSRTMRSDLEGYLNDLKKFKYPHEAAFSGMLTNLELLRADEINKLTPRGQEPLRYVFRATVREMPSS